LSRVAYANRRSDERFVLNPPAEAVIETVGEALLVDISARGARVQHNGRLSPGTTVRLKFRPAAGSIQLALRGTVVWSEPIDPLFPDSHMSGLFFGEEATGLRTAIERLCESGGATRV
jgi:hypothetical protein